jgi:hypothetical protein
MSYPTRTINGKKMARRCLTTPGQAEPRWKVRRMETTSSRPRKIRTCRTCRADISHRGNSAIYCPPCRVKAYAFPTERPCKSPICSNTVQRSGKVYPYFCSAACKPRCSFDPCDRPMRKRELCIGHYNMQRNTGELQPFKWEWVKLGNCKTCGSRLPAEWKSGQFCNSACWAHWHAYDGRPPLAVRCVQCDTEVPLTKENGRRRRSDTLTCRDCQSRYDQRRVLSKNDLAARDGLICGECGAEVDLEIPWPDLMCGSVDHIHPRSRGGTDDPENLQLTHLICNLRKGARAFN